VPVEAVVRGRPEGGEQPGLLRREPAHRLVVAVQHVQHDAGTRRVGVEERPVGVQQQGRCAGGVQVVVQQPVQRLPPIGG
jgi:hypothetical protein